MSAARATTATSEGLQSQSPVGRHFSAAASPSPTPLLTTPAAQRRRTLQDRAWDLACQGLRAPAIADALGVPERTVRSWLTAIRREAAQELREQHADELLLAVESVRHVAATAWAAYERETDREIANQTAAKPDRRASQAPRYLTLALASHVQAARLLGLYRKDAQLAYDAALTDLATQTDPDEFPPSAESAEISIPAQAASSPPPAPTPARQCRDLPSTQSAESAEIPSVTPLPAGRGAGGEDPSEPPLSSCPPTPMPAPQRRDLPSTKSTQSAESAEILTRDPPTTPRHHPRLAAPSRSGGKGVGG